jgi:hypothetical protein
MKKTTSLIFLLFISFALTAQTTDVASGIENPFDIVTDGSYLYTAAYGDGVANDGIIYKINISNNTKETFMTGLSGPFGLAINGNDLYISQRIDAKISKVNLNITTLPIVYNPSTDDFVNVGLNDPAGLLINGTTLYVTEINNNRIQKIEDIDTSPSAPSLFVNTPDAGPTSMLLNGDTMYISGRDDNKILKIADIASPSVSTFIDFAPNFPGPAALAFKDNILYVSLRDDDKIVSIDINDTSLNITEEVAVNIPFGLVINDTDLYIAQSVTNGKIVKYGLTVLSNEQVSLNASFFRAYPNPTKDYVNISGIVNQKAYEIYNLLGSLIKKGSVSSNKSINIAKLDNGMYLLKIEGGHVIKIIKE